MRTEQQIRLQGFDQENIQKAMIWDNIGRDLMREMVETEPLYKTLLDRHIIAALQGFASYPSMFYQNAFIYLQLNLAEQRELKNYSDRVGQMYMNQLNKELESRHVYSLIDNNGRVTDQIIY